MKPQEWPGRTDVICVISQHSSDTDRVVSVTPGAGVLYVASLLGVFNSVYIYWLIFFFFLDLCILVVHIINIHLNPITHPLFSPLHGQFALITICPFSVLISDHRISGTRLVSGIQTQQ